MGKKQIIEFTKELAKLYHKVEECYNLVKEFQKKIGFKKVYQDKFLLDNIAYIIGNDILLDCNFFWRTYGTN